jgi:hypothetical protein
MTSRKPFDLTAEAARLFPTDRSLESTPDIDTEFKGLGQLARVAPELKGRFTFRRAETAGIKYSITRNPVADGDKPLTTEWLVSPVRKPDGTYQTRIRTHGLTVARANKDTTIPETTAQMAPPAVAASFRDHMASMAPDLKPALDNLLGPSRPNNPPAGTTPAP